MTWRKGMLIIGLVVGVGIGWVWLDAKSRGVGLVATVNEALCGSPAYQVPAGTPLLASIVQRIQDPLVDQPVDATELPDGSLLVALKPGALLHLEPVSGAIRELLDIRSNVRVSLEQGLLAVAAHPSFGRNGEGRVYITYIESEEGRTVLASIVLDPITLAPVELAQVLLSFDHYNENHNAADLEFTTTGTLLLSTGDSGGSGDPEQSSQDPESLLGKILEVDVEATPVTASVRAKGLRNPWKIAMEPSTGALWITDVGQSCVEEVSVLDGDSSDQQVNFGWPIFEGDNCYAALTCTAPPQNSPPRTSYVHKDGRCSIIGAAFTAELFIFSDYCTGELFALPTRATAGTEPTSILWTGKRPRIQPGAIYAGPSGRVWLLDQRNSEILEFSVRP